MSRAKRLIRPTAARGLEYCLKRVVPWAPRFVAVALAALSGCSAPTAQEPSVATWYADGAVYAQPDVDIGPTTVSAEYDVFFWPTWVTSTSGEPSVRHGSGNTVVSVTMPLFVEFPNILRVERDGAPIEPIDVDVAR